MANVEIKDEFDHMLTDEIVCPHCGYEHTDSWEAGGDRQEDWTDECGECGKKIYVVKTVTVQYTTSIPKG